MDKIEFIVKNGSVAIDVLGASGPACEMLTKEIEEKLGIVADRTKKSEWYAQTEQSSQAFTSGT